MIIQYENKVLSNLLLYLDHMVLSKGLAFSNHTSYFYPTQSTISDSVYNYSAPFKQLVFDASITGANILTKVKVDGVDTPVGQGGLVGINHNDGTVRFNQQIAGANRISGDYAIKDFNFYFTNKEESTILFEEKIHLRPKTHEVQVGLPQNAITYPCIFVKSMFGENKPFAFGGIDQTEIQVRLIALADSLFLIDAVCSILKDLNLNKFSFIESLNPFNAYGDYIGAPFNYDNLVNLLNPINCAIINRVSVSKNINKNFNNVNKEIHAAFIDLEVIEIRKPRQ